VKRISDEAIVSILIIIMILQIVLVYDAPAARARDGPGRFRGTGNASVRSLKTAAVTAVEARS